MKVGYAVNLTTGAMTRYTHWPFTHMGRFQGADIAVDGSGVYRIGADTAAGTSIVATARIDGLRFRSDALKRITRVYLEYRPGGDIDIGLAPDEGVIQTYRLQAVTEPLGKRRVRTARGPKATYWSLVLSNVEGAAMDINAVQLQAEVLKRRVSG